MQDDFEHCHPVDIISRETPRVFSHVGPKRQRGPRDFQIGVLQLMVEEGGLGRRLPIILYACCGAGAHQVDRDPHRTQARRRHVVASKDLGLYLPHTARFLQPILLKPRRSADLRNVQQ